MKITYHKIKSYQSYLRSKPQNFKKYIFIYPPTIFWYWHEQ